jgi:hypothetical protein
MNRLALLSSSSLLGLVLSCGGAPETKAVMPVAEASEPDTVVEAPAVADEYADVLPTGSFLTIEALCAKQREIAAPRVAEKGAQIIAETEGTDPIGAYCEISDALENVHVSVSLPVRVLSAIEVETGDSRETFLVVNTEDGWTAVRQAFRSAVHMDPGCPSITRESGFESIDMKNGVLLVQTLADRQTYSEEGYGDVDMKSVRVCRLGASCDEPVVIEETVTRYNEGHEKDTIEKTSTEWTLDETGAIAVSQQHVD